MKKVCYKSWVKAVAAILALLMGNLLIASAVLAVACEGEGVYSRPIEEVREEKFEVILRNYSIVAMKDYQKEFAKAELEKTNFRYGIIQADSIEGLDLTDMSNYLFHSFDQDIKEENLNIYSCNMGDSTLVVSGRNLWDTYQITNNGSIETVKHRVEQCYYVRDLQDFYFLAEDGKIYAVADYVQSEPGDIEAEQISMTSAEQSALESAEQEETVSADLKDDVLYSWKNPEDIITIGDILFYYSDIEIVKSTDLSEYEIVDNFYGTEGNWEYFLENGQIVTTNVVYENTEPYYVISYAANPITQADGEQMDMFGQTNVYLNLLYTMRYSVFVIFIVTVILFLGSIVVLCIGAGHQKGEQELRQGIVDKIPLDLYSLMTGLICALLLIFEIEGIDYIGMRFFTITGILVILVIEILVELYFYSLVARIKFGKWWRNTLGYKLLAAIGGRLRKISHLFPMMWKAWFLMGIVAFCEFVGIMQFGFRHMEFVLILWMFEKVLIYGGLTLCLLQMKTLQQGSERIVQGDIESHIDTDKMFWELKKHGENLNNIRTGLNQAVEEQLKSERFKTELITNVSHDIKTPLTSIINYVDLLEKENIQNPTEKEYLEVLSRQSARLKKLIEDLMEASKASTGNLSVTWQTCDAGVILTQIVGEFEEKLETNGINLLVDCKENIMITADPRHLWRIMENLMNNICKYAQPSTRAYVNIEKQEEKCRIIFRNTSKYPLNIGSDELMERFVRGDSSRNTEGSGLGLSIARSLTELMKGTFQLTIDGDLFKVEILFPVNQEENK